MPKHRTEEIRNIALVGHGAVGKTTLADSMLFKAGAVDRKGNVDEASSVADFEEEEKKRHFSIDAALLHLEWKDRQVQIIDAPGYPDFIGAAISALHAVESAAIVIAATAGIEVNTRRVFEEAGKLGLARFVVINKLDAENVPFDDLIAKIQETFGKACVPLNLPLGLGEHFNGVVGTLEPAGAAPADIASDPAEANQALLDSVVEVDEELMVRYLDGEQLQPAEIRAALAKAVASGRVIPILCTSARKDIGIAELLDTIVECAPAPAQIKRTALRDGGAEVEIAQTADAPLLGQVFKSTNDKFVGKLSFFRVYSGTLPADTTITNQRTGKTSRTGHLFRLQGKHQEPVQEAGPGDIVAVAKVEDLGINDTISQNGTDLRLPPIEFPVPMAPLAVEPKARGDEQKISGSLHVMADEDPTFQVRRDRQTGELVITGMSQLHLEVIQGRLKRRFDLDVLTKTPRVPYLETITTKGEADYRHKKQSGGRGQFGEVHLRVYPLERGKRDIEGFVTKEKFPHARHVNYDPELNFAFIDSVVGGTIPTQYIPAVEKGVHETLDKGVLAGYHVQDVAVEVHFGKSHPVDSSEAAFKIAGSQAFKAAFLSAHPVLLEPVHDIEITVPIEKSGDIMGDLNTRRGRIQGMDALPGGFQVIKAQVPLSEVLNYATSLRSITGGQGSYTMTFSHYDLVPTHVQQQVVEKAQKDKGHHHEEE